MGTAALIGRRTACLCRVRVGEEQEPAAACDAPRRRLGSFEATSLKSGPTQVETAVWREQSAGACGFCGVFFSFLKPGGCWNHRVARGSSI